MKNLKIKIKGMRCHSCEMIIEDSLSETGNIEDIKISHEKGTLSLDYDESEITEDEIKEIIKKEGYEVD
ncbi:MAG: heavy-metal-associated domain-containing protein [Candidatus Woesearchaeota archaeon]